MARFLFIRLPSGDLRAADDAARDAVRKFADGEILQLEIKKERNPKNHRRFFALLQVVAAYSEVFNTTERALHAVKIAAGWCEFVANPLEPGELMAVPKSISYASLDEIEFQSFFSQAVQGVISHILPNMDEESMEAALNEVMGF